LAYRRRFGDRRAARGGGGRAQRPALGGCPGGGRRADRFAGGGPDRGLVYSGGSGRGRLIKLRERVRGVADERSLLLRVLPSVRRRRLWRSRIGGLLLRQHHLRGPGLWRRHPGGPVHHRRLHAGPPRGRRDCGAPPRPDLRAPGHRRSRDPGSLDGGSGHGGPCGPCGACGGDGSAVDSDSSCYGVSGVARRRRCANAVSWRDGGAVRDGGVRCAAGGGRGGNSSSQRYRVWRRHRRLPYQCGVLFGFVRPVRRTGVREPRGRRVGVLPARHHRRRQLVQRHGGGPVCH
ncbi:unnamed protein product, partial [Ectocarpus fasciculatus]